MTMLDKILDFADPHLAEIIWTLIVLPILNRLRWIARTKESREALHSALKTGVDKITDLLVVAVISNPIGFKLDQYAGQVADHVFDSVPDSLKFLLSKPWFMRLFGLKPMSPAQQRAWIEGMAIAKLNEWAADFIAKMGADKLPADDGWRAPKVPL